MRSLSGCLAALFSELRRFGGSWKLLGASDVSRAKLFQGFVDLSGFSFAESLCEPAVIGQKVLYAASGRVMSVAQGFGFLHGFTIRSVGFGFGRLWLMTLWWMRP